MDIFSKKSISKVNRFIPRLRMCRLDTNPVPTSPGEIRLFLIIRNESIRLPYLFSYYGKLGVDRIFVLDNNSDDDTISFLLRQKKTHIFQTKEKFSNIRRRIWNDVLLRQFGVGYWCVIVDSDEFLYFPYFDKLSLKDLCTFLDKEGFTALHCFLLDMYSNKPICNTTYTSGQDVLDVAHYFDPASHFWWPCPLTNCNQEEVFKYFGGVRKRVFNLDACVSKFPLMKFKPGMYRAPHDVMNAAIADIRGALFHFKFFNNLSEKALQESKREVYFQKGLEYKAYAKKLMDIPDLNLHYEKSVKFTDYHQLIKLGIMKSSAKFDSFARK